MNVEDLSSFALQRIAVYEGMAIDAATWTEAHAYHQLAQRFHTRAFHGCGIVTGLAVTPTAPPSRAVIVQPGVAIDADGNVIRVPQPLRVDLDQARSGTICVAVRFAEAPATENGNGPGRMAELYQIVAAASLPLPPGDIELARVEVKDAAAPFGAAADEWNPQAHELDGRFRRDLRPAVKDTLAVGQLALVDGGTNGLHRHGLVNVVRDLRASAPFVVQFIGDVRADQAAGQCDLLYISGAGELRLTPREGAHVLAFLRGGGVIFAEPCAERERAKQENGRFVASFQRLMSDFKHGLEEVGLGHPLFNSRHVFAAAPEGAAGHAPILNKGSVILNPNDYGCFWEGAVGDKPLVRDLIRDAIEFGANVAWYAANPASRPTPAPERVGAAARAAT